jgi:DNA invertase Pin-like site-specific DNA recombinase
LGADTDPFVLHLFAALAEKERALISQRTKAGLARGIRLGNPDMERLRGLGVYAVKAEADRHAAMVRPIIENIQARGAKSLRAIAAELIQMRIPTARGGTEWSAQQVSNILKRTN